MSTRLDRLFGRTRTQRRWRLGAVIAGVMLVPLAVAGLVTGGLANANDRLDTVPAIIVNNDEMVTTTAADGTKTPVLAGRLLVTQLTAPGGAGFAWTLSNSAEAKKALADGSTYAVLTIPKDFSSSITSLQGSSPTQADLSIKTDDAHSYLAGSAAQSVGEAMTNAFGRAITEQYLSGFYANLAGMGGSLSSAADGATQVSDGVASLAGGLDQLSSGVSSAASGAASAADGAAQYSNGVTSYTQGVDSLASGLQTLSSQTAQLGALGTGVTNYTQAVSGTSSQLAGQFSALQAAVAALPEDEQAGFADVLTGIGTSSGTLSAIGAQGPALASGASGLGALSSGIAQTASGAGQLSGGSAALRSGAEGIATGVGSLSDGLGSLATGTASSASGAHQLAEGAGTLSKGLTDGASQASALDGIDADKTASVVAQPVTVTSTRENPISTFGEVIGIIFVPVGLWIGALAVFLLLRPLSAVALQSTASTGRLVTRTLARASAIALVQAVLVVGLLHTVLGVTWATLPATLSFAILTALAFTAIHQFLTVAFGRIGIVISLLMVIVQLTSANGIYPVEILAGPYQVITPFLPLTWAVQGMQNIIAGVGGSAVAASAAGLAAIGILAVLGSLVAVARKRGARSWGFALARG